MMRRLILICALLLGMPLAAEPVPEYAMKAAFLYNFALFTEWPSQINGTLNLCVLGTDPFGAALDSIDGKQVKGARLTLLHIATAANARQCHILYFSDSEYRNARQILDELGDAPVLTVTDAEDATESGAIINMVLVNRRLTFEVNNEAARRAHLSLSSKMLRLAQKVY